MKRILFLSLWALLSFGCGDAGNRTKTGGETPSLHFIIAPSGNSSPMALLNVRGSYHLIYTNADGLAQSVSQDLINWSESSKMVFSKYNHSALRGAIVIDSGNITGYGSVKSPPLVAVLTGVENHDSISQKTQAFPVLAFSTDDGASWSVATDPVNFPKSFINNPQNSNILWYPPSKKWIMSLVLSDRVEFYSSPDLRSWTFESLLGPDFFPEEVKWKRATLFLSGDHTHWVLLADIEKSGKFQTSGNTVYFIGNFDGHQFINQSAQLHWLDYGENIYGSVISIGPDGRAINIAWKNHAGEQPSKTNKHVRQIITIPRELNLAKEGTEWFITASPVRELKKIYGSEIHAGPLQVSYKARNTELVPDITIPAEVNLKFNSSDIQKGSFPTRFGVRFLNNKGMHLDFGFDRFGFYYLDQSGLLSSTGTAAVHKPVKMPFTHLDSTLNFHIIISGSVIECFTEGGKLVMTNTYSTNEPFNKIMLFSEKGNIDLPEGRIIELRPAKPIKEKHH